MREIHAVIPRLIEPGLTDPPVPQSLEDACLEVMGIANANSRPDSNMTPREIERLVDAGTICIGWPSRTRAILVKVESGAFK